MAHDEVYRRGISIFKSDCITLKDEAATDLQTPCSILQRQERKQTCAKCPAKASFRGVVNCRKICVKPESRKKKAVGAQRCVSP